MHKIIIPLVAVVALTGCGAQPASTPTPTATQEPRLQVAARSCQVFDRTADENKSMTLNAGAEDGSSRDEISDVTCVLEHLDAPSYVTEHISSTRALDGQQTDTWDDMTARWTYHPDAGLTITFIDARI